MELNKTALGFFLGVMVGIAGNFLVSSTLEFGNGLFESASPAKMLYLSLILASSGIVTFQIAKVGIRFLDKSMTNKNLRIWLA